MKHKLLLMGESGSGKTTATATLAGIPGKKVFYIMMEDSMRVVQRRMVDLFKAIPENVYWKEIPYQGPSIDSMILASEGVLNNDEDGQIKWRDKSRKQAVGYHTLLKFLKNMVDDRTGQAFGSIESLDDSWIVVFDSLTTIAEMIWAEYMGARIAVDPREYGGPQSKLSTFLSAACWEWPVNIVITAHTEERETAPKSGVFKRYPRSIGGKLKEEIGQYFDDVILCKRMGKDKFEWDNATLMAATKSRDLPPGTHVPDARLIYESIAKVAV